MKNFNDKIIQLQIESFNQLASRKFALEKKKKTLVRRRFCLRGFAIMRFTRELERERSRKTHTSSTAL